MKKKIIIAAAALFLVGGGAGGYFFLFAPGADEAIASPVRGYVDPPDDGAEVTDPVANSTCKKTFMTDSVVYEQKTYYFCCPICPAKFIRNPQEYADEE